MCLFVELAQEMENAVIVRGQEWLLEISVVFVVELKNVNLVMELESHECELKKWKEVFYIKRNYRQKDFNAVKTGEPPIELTRYAGKVL